MKSFNRSYGEVCKRFPKMTEEEFASIRSCKRRLVHRLTLLDEARRLAIKRRAPRRKPGEEANENHVGNDFTALNATINALYSLLKELLAAPQGSDARRRIEEQIGMTTCQFQETLVLLTTEWLEWKTARKIGVEHNMRLVASVARRFARRLEERGYEPLDAFNSGVSGLMIAIDRFDPERDVKFSTYAIPWIKERVQLFLDEGCFIRVPAMKRRILTKKTICENKLFMATGRNASLDLVEFCNLQDERDSASVKDVKNRVVKSAVAQRGIASANRVIFAPDSLDAFDASNNDDDDESAAGAIWACDDRAKDPADCAQDAENCDLLFKALLTLGERPRLIVVLKFGSSYSLDALCLTRYISEQRRKSERFESRVGDLVNRCGNCSFEEIGELFGITRQRADQLFRDALGKLESSLPSNMTI